MYYSHAEKMFLKFILLFAFFFNSLVTCNGRNLTIDECLTKVEKLDERLQNLESNSSFSRRLLLPESSSYSKVAFYTQLSKDVDHIGNHQSIVFDTVTTNIGGGYNSADGIFTAPVTGTYVFFWLTTNRDHSSMDTDLVKNAIVVGKSFSDAYDHLDYASSSNTAVLQLTEGEEIWVRSGTRHSNAITGEFFSTFSGWLLYQALVKHQLIERTSKRYKMAGLRLSNVAVVAGVFYSTFFRLAPVQKQG